MEPMETCKSAKTPAFKITGQNFFSFIIQQFGHLFGMQNALLFMTLGLNNSAFNPIHSSNNIRGVFWLGKKPQIHPHNIVCATCVNSKFSIALKNPQK